MNAAEWLMSETPGIYVWKARVGWRFRVMFQFAGTVGMWRPTKAMAYRAAERIVEREG